MWGLFLQHVPCEGAPSLNLFLLHMYHQIYEPLLYSIAARAGVLMHFMLITLTYLLAVWVEWVVFLEVFSFSHNFIQFFLVRTCLMCLLLWTVTYPVAQNLYVYLFVDLFQTVASGNFFLKLRDTFCRNCTLCMYHRNTRVAVVESMVWL